MGRPAKPLRHRIQVSLPPPVYEVLHELADESGVAMASLCGNMLSEAMPAFQAMLAAVKMAKEKNADAYDFLASALIENQAKSSQIQLEIDQERQKLRRAAGTKDSDA